MLILDAISQGFGNQMDKLGGALSDPMMPTGNYSDVPMAPVGGFIRNNPNFMNTDQLILSGIY